MNEVEHHYDECPSDSPEKQKPKLGRKISRVLSIFRKEPKSLSKEPVYEELHEVHDGSEISAPQYSISTMGRLDSGISSGSDLLEPSFAEVLRNGAPFPQVVAPNGWWVRGFRHRAPTLFLPVEELKPVDIAYIDTSVKIDKKTLFYREEFIGKEHLNLVGYSRLWGPLVLSIKDRFLNLFHDKAFGALKVLTSVLYKNGRF
ncbi:Oidioi.mRNA.OKI2018_I69.PAR.g8521.t1.cds [Oikopleura dioica]|uniref:Oidioi.mRNA.OKI2018_I69.PAR.g8521.t1.cds n=1 Tax=Oikopleura dioica TaxID=34765 RepID=A0ABN7RJR6_OIKDI|nr:Oidioi.mRNA.OKI2018_I69.PAR.g8521.t1.cds [Oikopleura dioica]